MNATELLQQYSRGLASTGKTRSIYLKYAEDYVAFAAGDFSRERLAKYLEHLRKQHHYSDGTINFAFRVARTFFNRNKLEWPYRRGESPGIHEDRIQAPALHPDTIGRAIVAVRENGDPAERAFLALSTTYGVRRVEMVGIEAEDIRFRDKTIHIATAKHGRERTHVIPDAIIPYLAAYDFSQKRSEFSLFSLWYQIESLIGLPHTTRVGWHSIRRTLNTLLLRKLNEATVMSFLRWKQRTSSHMPYRYSAIKFVGEEGTSTEVVGDALDVDNEVFAVHPFLEFWR